MNGIPLYLRRNNEEKSIDIFDFLTKFGCIVDNTLLTETGGEFNVSIIRSEISFIKLIIEKEMSQ